MLAPSPVLLLYPVKLLVSFFLHGLAQPLFLLPPMAALLIVLADAQGLPQFFALLDLSGGELMDLVLFQIAGLSLVEALVGRIGLLLELLAEGITLVVDFILVDTTRERASAALGMLAVVYLPLIFQTVAKLKDLDLYFALTVMLEDVLVRLALAVLLDLVIVLGVGCGLIARLEERQIALHIARSPASAGRSEADVGGHVAAGAFVGVWTEGQSMDGGGAEAVLSEPASSGASHFDPR